MSIPEQHEANHPLTPSPAHPLGEALPIKPKLSINIRQASMRDDFDIKNIDALHKANVDGGEVRLFAQSGISDGRERVVAEYVVAGGAGGGCV